MDVTCSPKCNSFIDAFFWNQVPTTAQSIVTDVRPLQPWKAVPLIDVTEFGIVKAVSPLQSLKAYSPISDTDSGTVSSLEAAKTAGAVTMNIGFFINSIISFLIVAFAIFSIIKVINKMKEEPAPAPAAPTTKKCPYCFSEIDINATKCPHCTSDLK